MARRVRTLAGFIRALAVSSLVVAVFAGALPSRLQAEKGASAALPSVVAAVEQARHGRPIPAHLVPPFATIKLYPARYTVSRGCLAHNRSRVVPSRVCRVGKTSSRKLIVLLGDSHAFMWLPPTLVMAKRDGWAVVPLIRLGCAPEKWFTNMGPNGPICRAWLSWAISEVNSLRPTVILLGGRIPDTPSTQTTAAAAGIVEAARTLARVGRVIIIGDPEGLATNSVDCLRSHRLLVSCMTTWSAPSLAAYDVVAREARPAGAGFLPTRGFVCYERRCPAVVGNTIVWMDTNHLTRLYSAQLADPFRAAFRRLLR